MECKKKTNKAINQKLQLMAATCIAVQPSGPGRSGSIGRSRSASTSFGEFETHALTIASWWSEVAGQKARSTSFSGSEVNCSSSVQTELSLACNNLWRNRKNPVHFTKLCLVYPQSPLLEIQQLLLLTLQTTPAAWSHPLVACWPLTLHQNHCRSVVLTSSTVRLQYGPV